MYAIRFENEDNEVYYNIWNVDTDKWLLSASVDYLRFENIENENDLSILIVDSETIYLVEKNKRLGYGDDSKNWSKEEYQKKKNSVSRK